MSSIKSAVQRSVFDELGPILGAFALIGLANSAVELHQWVRDWALVWNAVTRPVWELTLAPVLASMGVNMPTWSMDYLTAGAIVAAMTVRYRSHFARAETQAGQSTVRARWFGLQSTPVEPFSANWVIAICTEAVFQLLFWPHTLFRRTWIALTPQFSVRRRERRGLSLDEESMQRAVDAGSVFFRTLAYAAVLLVLNYVLLIGG